MPAEKQPWRRRVWNINFSRSTYSLARSAFCGLWEMSASIKTSNGPNHSNISHQINPSYHVPSNKCIIARCKIRLYLLPQPREPNDRTLFLGSHHSPSKLKKSCRQLKDIGPLYTQGTYMFMECQAIILYDSMKSNNNSSRESSYARTRSEIVTATQS